MTGETKLEFDSVQLLDTSNWRRGIPFDPKVTKKLCCVVFRDGSGNKYIWFPTEDKAQADGELNDILYNFIKADNLNVDNLKNPEPRYDILNFSDIVKTSRWIKNPSLLKEAQRRSKDRDPQNLEM